MRYNNMKSRRLVKESYEVSEDLANRLNSILADEFLAAEFYRLAELAMKGNKQHRLSEIADENGEDELEDHFKNLSEWMQSKGIKVVTNHDEMLDITNATVFTVEDGDSTSDIVDKLIQSEEEAIEAYENLIPDTDLDLHTMLCGFLKDEREHLKALTDARDEMGGSRYDGEDKPKHTIYEGKNTKKRMNEEFDYDPKSYGDDVKFRVYDIAWDTDGEDVDLPDEVVVDVPAEVVDYGDVNDFIADYLSDEYGFCHNGFLIDEI
jgi:ferritin-like protein